MNTMYPFHKKACINAVENWGLEPFTVVEKAYLLDYFENHEDEYLEYGEDSIDSLILEILSDMDN